MASSPHILYAHREDEITALLDAIDAQDASDVLLVVPRGALLFRDFLNLKLLKRECEKLHKNLTISTEDVSGIAFAKKAGIAVEVLSEGEKFFEEWPGSAKAARGSKIEVASISTNPSHAMTTASSQHEGASYTPKPSLPSSRRGGRGRAMDIMVRKGAHALASHQTPEMPPAPSEHKPSPDSSRPGARGQSPPAARGVSPEEFVQEEVAPEKPARRMFPVFSKKFLIPSAIVLVLAGIFGAGGHYIKPSASISVFPKEETVEFEMDLSGRTEITSPDTAKAIVPLERFSAEETITQEFASSGNKEITTRAHGRLTVYNTFSSVPQNVVATTRFLSESGKLFRTPKAVTIPGAKVENGTLSPGSIEIEVVADLAGAEYNIPPSRFSIPGFAGTAKEGKFYGENREGMAGGFKRLARMVEKKDIEAAKAALVPSELERVKELLRKKFPPNLNAIEGALSVTNVEASATPREGEPGEKFMLTVRTIAQALLFSEQDVLGVVEPNIAQHLAAKYRTLPETRKISYLMRQYDPALGRLAFTALASVRRQAIIDELALREHLANMNINQAKAYFADQDQIERVNLSLWPFWSRRLPADPSRIKVIVGP